ncbi:MAG: cell wall metabolism sensor histidine kinase WalK [Candidatus Nomurabacteria bacterium]|nr:cell wall metabolism sensor histidine kinase WalK [Candidatus Nomurabacteria bacterium]
MMVLIATDILHGSKVLAIGCCYLILLLAAILAYGVNKFDLDVLFDITTTSILTVCTVCFIAWLNSINLIRMDAYEQMKSREQMQHDRLLTVINNISDSIISVTGRGIVRLYNAATLSLLDTNSTLNGKKIDSIVNLVDTSGNPVNISDMMDKTRTIERDDLLHVFEDGQRINIFVSCSPVRASYGNEAKPESNGAIVVLRDITKAKSLDEERDEFISVVSHELRTPITIAEGATSNLQAMLDMPSIEPKLLKGAAESAHSQTLYLAKMINDLSTLSRAERGIGSETEVIDIRDMINKLYSAYHGDAEQKGLRMDINIENVTGKIKTSRLYVEEMLQNFITNAIKYTTEGSVTLQATEFKGKVTFSISDTGIGIGHTDQKHIFDKFYRGEDYRTRETSGTGLGLYVAAKLARKLNTHINFNSKINHGSTFSFSMPLYIKQK